MRLFATALMAAWLGAATCGLAADDGQLVPTGQRLTPTAAAGAVFQPLNPGLEALPRFIAGQASALALSPNGRTLLILTSGFNLNFGPDGKPAAGLSDEYVFVYDVSGPAPVRRQALHLANSFLGLAWAPSGQRFYVSGGVDDMVQEFEAGADGFHAARRFALGHSAGLGLEVKPEAAGVAISPDGRRLIVANLQNDSVSLIDLEQGKAVDELDLRPGKADLNRRGAPGGTFPRAIAFASDSRAFVTAERDREIIALGVAADRLVLARRIRTPGQPTALLADRAGGRLFVALDNTDGVLALDVASGRRLASLSTLAPAALASSRIKGGANSNALALSPDRRTLYVSNGGENAVAVVRLGPRPRVTGLIPTGWYPTALTMSRDGQRLFVVNAKSDTGPNPGGCRNTLRVSISDAAGCTSANQYVWKLEKAGFLTVPTPGRGELARLTVQVAKNDGFVSGDGDGEDAATMAFLRQRIRHVVYIVKENRTYDQVLGDLEIGDGDPRLALFPEALTPNHHGLARRFVTLDRFFDSGESSNTGWTWTTAARTTDFTEREAPVNYADRGLQYDQEGTNRNVNVGLPTPAARVAANALTPDDPDLLAGTADVAAPDGPDGEQGRGYIWDAAIRAGLTVRNWGFFGDLSSYEPKYPTPTPLDRDPFASRRQVFFPTKPALMALSDPYYRGFDQSFPDYWRFKEWDREFEGFVAKGQAPALMLIRLPHDHLGRFGAGIDGVDTVETEIADNDYALGLIVQAVAQSPFAKDTLVFVVEDDAQDGPDHVNAHRSIALIAGPYVRQAALISQPFTTVNVVRTIEDVLGLPPLGLNDALARPMSAVFDRAAERWSYRAEVPAILRTTALPIPPADAAPRPVACLQRPRSAAYWARAMAGQNFDVEDHLDTPRFNRALWRGLAGAAPYPMHRAGQDLRRNRAHLLAAVEAGCPPGV